MDERERRGAGRMRSGADSPEKTTECSHQVAYIYYIDLCSNRRIFDLAEIRCIK